MTLDYHEAANIFPLDEENIGELAKDIRKTGQQEKVKLLDGKIIDGRRRYKACQLIGIAPLTENVNPADPIAYVVSLNLHRRHLTPSQKAAAAQLAEDLYKQQAKERQKFHAGTAPGKGKTLPVSVPEVKGDARDLAGEAFGVSGSLIDRARVVRKKGVPELMKAVEEGRMSVTKAAKLTEEEEETQREAASQAHFSGGRYRLPMKAETNGHADPDNDPDARVMRGKGVALATEAINCLIRIPKNDALRKRGLWLVTDWIKRNR